MPKCTNDPVRYYTGKEPSPKGFGWCAHAETLGKARRGRDGHKWVVKKVTGGSKRWVRTKAGATGCRHHSTSRERANRFVSSQVSRGKVLVFSKTFCPSSKTAKAAIRKLVKSGANVTVHELNLRGNGKRVQDALERLTGARTVPRVFVGGRFVGGGNNVTRLSKDGELAEILRAAGVRVKGNRL